MQRIDFLGAPGVGKSTLYNELVKQRVKSDTWMTPGEARARIAYEYSLQNARSVKNHVIAGLLKSSICKRLHPILSNKILAAYQKKTTWTEKDRYAKFFETALKGATIWEKDPLRRLMGITEFYSVATEVIFLEHSQFMGLTLFDESLSHKVYTITHWRKGFFEGMTNDYFSHIPLPTGLIYCKLEPEETFNRVKQRSITVPGQEGKIIPGHRDLNDNLLLESIKAQLDIAAIGAEVLRNRGVSILEVDMADTPAHNVKLIANALGDLA